MGGVSHRLPRGVRLTSGRDYRRMSRRSQRIRTTHFVMLISDEQKPEPKTAGARLGLTASRKVGNAVARNHVKRRVREWFRQQEAVRAMPIDLVVIAGVGSGRLTSQTIAKELSSLLMSERGNRAPRRG